MLELVQYPNMLFVFLVIRTQNGDVREENVHPI